MRILEESNLVSTRIEIEMTRCGRVSGINLPDVRFLGQRSTNWGERYVGQDELF